MKIFSLETNAIFIVVAALILAAFLAFSSNAFSQTNSEEVEEQNGQFRYIYGDELTREKANSVISHLEQNYSKVMSGLMVPELPTVTVRLWTSYESLYSAQYERSGQRFEGSAGSVWWSTEGGPEILAVYNERYEGMRQHTASLLHEFAHLVSMAINPSIPNNPRWLWESVAIYEAGEYRANLSGIDYIASRDFPTLAELDVGFNEANQARNIYQVGFTIAEYIVETWGAEGLISLVKRNGNILSTFGISTSEFESGWQAHLEGKL